MRPIRWRRSACAAIRAMAIRAWCMRSRTRTSTASAQIMHLPNVTLMTNSRVTRLLTNASGTAVTAVEVMHSGRQAVRRRATSGRCAAGFEGAATYTAGFFAVCAGAVNSAVILLASANDKHPTRAGEQLGPGGAQLHVSPGGCAAGALDRAQ